jgi:hypothetical protein
VLTLVVIPFCTTWPTAGAWMWCAEKEAHDDYEICSCQRFIGRRHGRIQCQSHRSAAGLAGGRAA